MYGKIFASMYDGTISANWKGLIIFQQMIVLCDSEGVIDITPPALSKRTGIPLDIIEDGIMYLSQPDPHSRSQEHEGRRIILIDEHRPWGWIIVNHQYYRDLSSVEDKREKARLRKQKQRGNESKQSDVTLSHTPSRMSHHADADTDPNTDNTDNTDTQFTLFWKTYPKKNGKKDAEKAFMKLNPDDQLFKIMMKALKAHKGSKDWSKDNGRYIPSPATWLNGYRWEDESIEKMDEDIGNVI
jgi:hypothetical protein